MLFRSHGPVKAMGLEYGVNVTAGLPIVRTSVDHGTAFDIAGSGRADASSLLTALRVARRMAGCADGGMHGVGVPRDTPASQDASR